MADLELSELAQHWVNVVLIWIGFGALAGLVAKALLPVRQPSSSLSILVLGITGSMIGLLVLSLLPVAKQLNPISPLGFLAATIGAFALLMAYQPFAALFGKPEGPESERE